MSVEIKTLRRNIVVIYMARSLRDKLSSIGIECAEDRKCFYLIDECDSLDVVEPFLESQQEVIFLSLLDGIVDDAQLKDFAKCCDLKEDVRWEFNYFVTDLSAEPLEHEFYSI
ncbi:hypothetical protein ACMXYX_07705 [Neptuniibacter sp. QD72_48]|uniref:hypothetical protein n=1 Tax=Neptuniibacter sp. QD72_48 TaxID=3398214 RepID=UPI0039F4535D